MPISTIVFEITEDGNLKGLYTDKVNLFSIGRVVNVKKASNVEFNEATQKWEVLLLNGKVLYTNKSRDTAIDWEIEAFSPGGKYYDPIL